MPGCGALLYDSRRHRQFIGNHVARRCAASIMAGGTRVHQNDPQILPTILTKNTRAVCVAIGRRGKLRWFAADPCDCLRPDSTPERIHEYFRR